MTTGIAAALTLVPATVVVVVGAVLMRRTPARFRALLVTFLLGAVADLVAQIVELVAAGALGTDEHPPLSLAALLALGVYFFGGVAPVEEGLKWLVTRRVLRSTSPAAVAIESATVVQACTAALGFATFEACLNTLTTGPQELNLVLLESIPMHLLLAAMWAFPLARSLEGRKPWRVAGYGLVLAVLLHGTIDLSGASVSRYFPQVWGYEQLTTFIIELYLAFVYAPKIISSVRAWFDPQQARIDRGQQLVAVPSEEVTPSRRHRVLHPRIQRRRGGRR